MSIRIATGIHTPGSGIGFWPAAVHISDDPDAETTPERPRAFEFSSAITAVDVEPPASFYPFALTSEQAEELNFRIKTIRLHGDIFDQTMDRHPVGGPFPFEPFGEETLIRYPGAWYYLNESLPGDILRVTELGIGFLKPDGLEDLVDPAAFLRDVKAYYPDQVWHTVPGSLFHPPNEAVPWDFADEELEILEKNIYRKPSICQFYGGREYPFIRLEWCRDLFTLYSTTGWQTPAGYHSKESGARAHFFDWGSVPIYTYWNDLVAEPATLGEDIYITGHRWFEYDGKYNALTGQPVL